LNCILPPANLRPYLIHAEECGILRDLEMSSRKSPDEKSVMTLETIEVADPTLVS